MACRSGSCRCLPALRGEYRISLRGVRESGTRRPHARAHGPSSDPGRSSGGGWCSQGSTARGSGRGRLPPAWDGSAGRRTAGGCALLRERPGRRELGRPRSGRCRSREGDPAARSGRRRPLDERPQVHFLFEAQGGGGQFGPSVRHLRPGTSHAGLRGAEQAAYSTTDGRSAELPARPARAPDGRHLFALRSHGGRGEIGGSIRPRRPGLRCSAAVGRCYAEPSPDGQPGSPGCATPTGHCWEEPARTGAARVRLTSPPLEAHLPRWSPDGRRIVFAGRSPERPQMALATSSRRGRAATSKAMGWLRPQGAATGSGTRAGCRTAGFIFSWPGATGRYLFEIDAEGRGFTSHPRDRRSHLAQVLARGGTCSRRRWNVAGCPFQRAPCGLRIVGGHWGPPGDGPTRTGRVTRARSAGGSGRGLAHLVLVRSLRASSRAIGRRTSPSSPWSVAGRPLDGTRRAGPGRSSPPTAAPPAFYALDWEAP